MVVGDRLREVLTRRIWFVPFFLVRMVRTWVKADQLVKPSEGPEQSGSNIDENDRWVPCQSVLFRQCGVDSLERVSDRCSAAPIFFFLRCAVADCVFGVFFGSARRRSIL